jgi:hypothetical protein
MGVVNHIGYGIGYGSQHINYFSSIYPGHWLKVLQINLTSRRYKFLDHLIIAQWLTQLSNSALVYELHDFLKSYA